MNTVQTNTEEETTADCLIGDKMSEHHHTAFVGCCGGGPKHNLYLIVFDCIIQADSPFDTWTDAHVIVDRYCDVTISEDEEA